MRPRGPRGIPDKFQVRGEAVEKMGSWELAVVIPKLSKGAKEHCGV